MGKMINSDVFDGALNVMKNSATAQIACSAEPTNYAEATTTYALADVAITSADLTLANGDIDGRKVTVAAKSGVEVDTSGTATHVALVDATSGRVLAVTTCDSLPLTAGSGNVVSFPNWTFTLRAPA
jgi:predicted transcriptional regulator